jgi:hypothetical protein
MRSPAEIQRAHDLLAAIAADEAHVVFILPATDVLGWVRGEGGGNSFSELLAGIETLARKRGFEPRRIVGN